MTTNPRFLALMVKVEQKFDPTGIWITEAFSKHITHITRALKVAIMAHEPIQNVGVTWCTSCYDPDKDSWVLFPCKPFLDIESEVGE